MPVLALTEASDGPETKLYVKVLAGKSESVADRAKLKIVPSSTVVFGTADKTGALFTSLTVTVKLLLSLKGGMPLSVTFTVTV